MIDKAFRTETPEQKMNAMLEQHPKLKGVISQKLAAGTAVESQPPQQNPQKKGVSSLGL